MTRLAEHRHSATPPVTATVTASVTAELVTHRSYDGDRAVVAACVRRAVEDLRGSVSLEALPEMAARLAVHRLMNR